MILSKNTNVEIMTLEDGDKIVFDPATGDTHFFNNIGANILQLLDEPTSLENLIDALTTEYDATAEAIKADVEPFIVKLLEMNILKRSL